MPLRGSKDTPKRAVDLAEVLLDVAEILGLKAFDAFLFGSRCQKTGSTRSDIDIALFINQRPTGEQARRVWELEPYLDIFYGEGGSVQSLVNESKISRPTRDELLHALGAVPLILDGVWQAGVADEHRIQT